jgi:colicin import membrane protein
VSDDDAATYVHKKPATVAAAPPRVAAPPVLSDMSAFPPLGAVAKTVAPAKAVGKEEKGERAEDTCETPTPGKASGKEEKKPEMDEAPAPAPTPAEADPKRAEATEKVEEGKTGDGKEEKKKKSTKRAKWWTENKDRVAELKRKRAEDERNAKNAAAGEKDGKEEKDEKEDKRGKIDVHEDSITLDQVLKIVAKIRANPKQ